MIRLTQFFGAKDLILRSVPLNYAVEFCSQLIHGGSENSAAESPIVNYNSARRNKRGFTVIRFLLKNFSFIFWRRKNGKMSMKLRLRLFQKIVLFWFLDNIILRIFHFEENILFLFIFKNYYYCCWTNLYIILSLKNLFVIFF